MYNSEYRIFFFLRFGDEVVCSMKVVALIESSDRRWESADPWLW